ncbi:ankyrin repeat-containing domain protein [Xylaria sp. FL1042]|nr:ankyrin repeat-containing domain protein [Xylaria sp. FL1042]
MHILDLAPELFHNILVFSIVARFRSYSSAGRAFRLKLVCKVFYHAFQPALFESRVLDTFLTTRLHNWSIRRHHSCNQLWHSYLVYRVRNETDPTICRFVEIQEIAREFCTAAQADYDETVDGLCRLALERGTHNHEDSNDQCDFGWAIYDQNPQLNLLSAAAYFGHLGLAKQLLADGCSPIRHDMFDSPMRLAAFSGNADMVILFQNDLPGVRDESFSYRYTKTVLESIDGAALRGDVDMLRLAMRPLSHSRPHNSNFNNQKFANVAYHLDVRVNWTRTLAMASTWDVFEYITSFCDPCYRFKHQYLNINAARGNMDMVRRLLDEGWDIDGNKGDISILTSAVQAYHEDIVDLLLELGANPNKCERDNSALYAAAMAGSMRMIRKLMDYGASNDNNEEQQRGMLCAAVSREHTEMVNFFFDQGFLNRECPEYIRKYAEERKLESMVELLKKWKRPSFTLRPLVRWG